MIVKWVFLSTMAFNCVNETVSQQKKSAWCNAFIPTSMHFLLSVTASKSLKLRLCQDTQCNYFGISSYFKVYSEAQGGDKIQCHSKENSRHSIGRYRFGILWLHFRRMCIYIYFLVFFAFIFYPNFLPNCNAFLFFLQFSVTKLILFVLFKLFGKDWEERNVCCSVFNCLYS